MSEPLRVLLSTAPVDGANALARQLVDEQLAACVNLVPGLISVYRWQGAVHEDPETLLVIKTRAALVARLTARLVELHPYDVPEVIALPLADGEGNPAYLQWVVEQTQPGS